MVVVVQAEVLSGVLLPVAVLPGTLLPSAVLFTATTAPLLISIRNGLL